jgi:hypothetical protein
VNSGAALSMKLKLVREPIEIIEKDKQSNTEWNALLLILSPSRARHYGWHGQVSLSPK